MSRSSKSTSPAGDTGLDAVLAYIAAQPEPAQSLLRELRDLIAKDAPGATEGISYGMPAFFYGKVLVYYAAFKSHVGLYPTASGVAAFESELGPYVHSKGAIQFPLGSGLPADLIARVVRFRKAELGA
jgi:uncharacterized protein YdhG (YjbR/CyaY superfamily)